MWMNFVGCQTSASRNGNDLMEIHDLQNIIAKLRVAMPDVTELSCAKAIALFKPGALLIHGMSNALNCTEYLHRPEITIQKGKMNLDYLQNELKFSIRVSQYRMATNVVPFLSKDNV